MRDNDFGAKTEVAAKEVDCQGENCGWRGAEGMGNK